MVSLPRTAFSAVVHMWQQPIVYTLNEFWPGKATVPARHGKGVPLDREARMLMRYRCM